MLLVFSNLKAEDEYYYHKLTKKDFTEWMNSVKIPGFSLGKTQVKGSEETYNIEYSADFNNDIFEVITPRIGQPDVFYGYEELKTHQIVGPYDLDGFVAVFIYHNTITKPSNLTYLLVQMPELQATFSITALTDERLTKDKMEEYFRFFRLKTIDNSKSVPWSGDIPIPIRVPGDIFEISEKNVNDGIVKKEITVKISKTDGFLRDLRKFYKEKRGWLDLLTFGNTTLVCKTTQDINVLDQMREGEPIEFVYYIK